MRWEKYKVPLLQLGLIVTGVVAIISLASVFILNARLKNQMSLQTAVRETSEADERQELEQQLMVYGCADSRALVIRDSLTLPAIAGNDIIMNGAEDVFAANDADGSYYIFRISDNELLGTYVNASYDHAAFIGQNRILLEDSGNFYCFDYTSGMQLWKWQFPYEDCLWEYDDSSETIYIMKSAPDRVTGTVTTEGSQQEADFYDRYDDNDQDTTNRNSVTEERLLSLSHDIYVLSINELKVNYIRPSDLIEDEMNCDSSVISDISLSDDHTMLLVNGSLRDNEEQSSSYFTRIYQLDTIDFANETVSEETDEDDETNETLPQTSEIVSEVTARYHERENSGRKMLTRWIDNESVFEYSEEAVIKNTSEEYDGNDGLAETDDRSEDGPGSYNISGSADIDELDDEPETTIWNARKRILSYGQTEWRISGSGVPTDDVSLLRFEEDDRTYLILVLSQCALTVDATDGREISQLIDTDDFIYIEPKNVRPTMYITYNGSVLQGKRHYSLGVSDISAVQKYGDTYYVSAGNSIFMYTVAANVADSGTQLTDSDEIRWNRALISDDGKYAVISGQRYLRLYSTENGTRLYQNIGTESVGPDVVFAGSRLCHPDASGQNIMIYDPDTAITDHIALPGSSNMQQTQIRSHGEQYILAASEDGQTVWIIDTEARSLFRTFTVKDLCDAAELSVDGTELEYCSMSPDMHYLVYSLRVSDDAGALSLKACIMDLTTSKTVMSDELAGCLDVVPDELPHLNCNDSSYSDDGQYVVFVSANNAVSVFDLAKGTCEFKRNCGELMIRPAFAPDNHVVCVTKAGDICVLDSKDGRFVTPDEDGSASLKDDLFSMDRPGAQVTLSFDRNTSKMYASGVRNGKTFVRVYTISDDGVLTPETEIPQAIACGSSLVLMRYGDSAAELFPYLTMDELRTRAGASPE